MNEYTRRDGNVCAGVGVNYYFSTSSLFLQEFVDSVSYTTRSCKPATLFIVRTSQRI